MTHAFLADLEDRKRQVRHYLLVVAREERFHARTHVAEGRLLTLRAGSFLILYNLVEATIRGSIQSIHDKITTKRTPFTSLNLELRKEVIERFKKVADASSNHTMPDFPSEFVAVALALDDAVKISGSVDARRIREIAETYGFSSATEIGKTRNGADLLTIKTNRNDLAHGLKTFEEVGRDYTASDLILIARRTMTYMTQVSHNIAFYLDREHYIDEICRTMASPIATASDGGTALPMSFPILRKFVRLFGLVNWN
jgi:hypothetical protein